MCRFVSYLAAQNLSHRSIKVYLAGVRYFQISAGGGNLFVVGSLKKLEYALKGIKRSEVEGGRRPRERLPVTAVVLRKLKSAWAPDGGLRDTKMLWAACCLGFFAFLRVGEMTIPSDSEYDPEVHLNIRDIKVDDASKPSQVQIRIKQSKTDPFRHGVSVVVGRTGSDLCPVAALLDYLRVRGMREGPLFLFESGGLLTRQRFVSALKTALEKAGIDAAKYNSHSLRIGAATEAASKGLGDAVIKTLGRWESVAYQQYVRIPGAQLAKFSSLLAAK